MLNSHPINPVHLHQADDYTMPYKRELSLRGDDNRFELNDEMASTTINVMHADGSVTQKEAMSFRF